MVADALGLAGDTAIGDVKLRRCPAWLERSDASAVMAGLEPAIRLGGHCIREFSASPKRGHLRHHPLRSRDAGRTEYAASVALTPPSAPSRSHAPAGWSDPCRPRR